MIETFAVFKHPSDYPDKWVCRRFVGEQADELPLLVGLSYDSVVEILSNRGLMKIPKSPEDVPSLVETWI